MKHYDITKPIGLATPCKEIESTCNNAHMYKRCGLRPKHYIIPLDPGSGRTTLVEYMTDKYKEAGALSFTSGLDDYIEIAFDGSLQQLKQAFAAIDSAAVYTNEYCNIIGMDISGVSAHLGETQLSEFMKNCKRVCEHACVIFFVHTTPNRNEEKLLEKLCETVDNIMALRSSMKMYSAPCLQIWFRSSVLQALRTQLPLLMRLSISPTSRVSSLLLTKVA